MRIRGTSNVIPGKNQTALNLNLRLTLCFWAFWQHKGSTINDLACWGSRGKIENEFIFSVAMPFEIYFFYLFYFFLFIYLFFCFFSRSLVPFGFFSDRKHEIYSVWPKSLLTLKVQIRNFFHSFFLNLNLDSSC